MNKFTEYNLYLSPLLKIFVFGLLALFFAVAIVITFRVLGSSDGKGPPQMLGIFIFGIVAWNSYWVLSIPHKITVSETGEITFISVLRKKHILASEIVSIKPERNQFGFLVVRSQKGKVRIINQFDSFHEFILYIKSVNPNVELRGC